MSKITHNGKAFYIITHCSASSDYPLGMVSNPTISNSPFCAAVGIAPMKMHYSPCTLHCGGFSGQFFKCL